MGTVLVLLSFVDGKISKGSMRTVPMLPYASPDYNLILFVLLICLLKQVLIYSLINMLNYDFSLSTDRVKD
jgi:hypothetical protein